MMKKLILILLSMIICCSFVVGCTSGQVIPSDLGVTNPLDDNSTTVFDLDATTLAEKTEKKYYDAVYEDDQPTDGLRLAKNGVTEYKIVIPANAGDIVKYAAEELKLYFDDSVGTDIEIITDSGLTYSGSAKYFSLGQTTIMNGANVTVDYTVTKRDGYVIKSVGNSFIMCGGGEYGTLYAVYEFLHRAIGWETYAIDEIYYEKSDELIVDKLDVLDVPAIESRTGGYFEGRENAYFCAKLRTYANYGIGIFNQNLWAFDVKWVHNYRYLLSQSGLTTKPEWYGSSGSSQICLTNDEVRNAVAQAIIRTIEKNPNIEYFCISQEDNSGVCQCAKCKAYDETHYSITKEGEKIDIGRPMLTIEFMKDVLGRVRKVIGEDKYSRCTFVSCIYAYNQEAPITWDKEQGKYVPYKDSLVIPDDMNLSFMFAPYEADQDYRHLSVDPEYNARWARIVEGYNILSPKMIAYLYGNNFGNAYEWFDDFSSYAINVKYFAEHGNAWFFSENSSGGKQSVQFQTLRAYVYSKLQWNPYLDMNELIDDFMDNYYKAGSEAMKAYFEYLRLQYESVFQDKYVDGSGNKVETPFTTWSSIYNSFESVVQRCDYISQALSAVENSSLDEFTKAQVIRRIKLEGLTDVDNLLKYHKNKLQRATLESIVEQFRADLKELEVYGWDDEFIDNKCDAYLK